MSEEQPRRARTRGNRDSKPYKRQADGKWVAVGYLPNGRRKPCYGDTSKEASDKRKQFYAELAADQPITIGNTETLGRYLRVWLEETLGQRVAAGKLDEDSQEKYRDTVRLHIEPHLGKVPIAELSTRHIRRWLLELADKPSSRGRKKLRPGEKTLPPGPKLSASSQRFAHTVLRKALADAVNDEVVKRNVCLLVDAPTVPRRVSTTPTKEQAVALLAAAADDKLWCYWLVVLALGLRRGEGLGMRWSNIDFEARTVRLRKQIVRTRGTSDPGTGKRASAIVVEKDLKTLESQATMKLPAVAVEALKRHRKAQAAEILASPAWGDEDLVFPSPAGTMRDPMSANRAWWAVCRRAGVDSIRIHDLRHATATYLLAEGLKEKVIQSQMRHTRLATTADVYLDVLEEVRDGAAEEMNGVLVDLTARARARTEAN